MSKLEISDLLNEIARLKKGELYKYPSGKNKIKIVAIDFIKKIIKAYRTGEDPEVSISEEKLKTAAGAFSQYPNRPIQFDRLYSASGNERSALEALLAYTPNFFICKVTRMNPYTDEIMPKKQKRIMWCPDESHPIGELHYKDYELIISEKEEEFDKEFGKIVIKTENLTDEVDTIEAKTEHTRMQVALVKIGNALGFSTWIAKPDQSIRVGDRTLGELEGVIQSLDEVPVLYTSASKEKANFIDTMWFSSNLEKVERIFEIEHSTKVTSGLTRMLKLKKSLSGAKMKFAVVAPPEMRKKTVTEANDASFRELECKFMSYPNVRELYSFVKRRTLSNNIKQVIVDAFLEEIIVGE